MFCFSQFVTIPLCISLVFFCCFPPAHVKVFFSSISSISKHLKGSQKLRPRKIYAILFSFNAILQHCSSKEEHDSDADSDDEGTDNGGLGDARRGNLHISDVWCFFLLSMRHICWFGCEPELCFVSPSFVLRSEAILQSQFLSNDPVFCFFCVFPFILLIIKIHHSNEFFLFLIVRHKP